jgi:cellulose biosynthesis protein BcsQ
MTIQIHLVGGLNGGAGRSLTAALLAIGLHLHGRKVVLIRQTCDGTVALLDPIESTLPLSCCTLTLPAPYVLPADLNAGTTALIHQSDDRFLANVHRLAEAEVGDDADVVVDLCCHERALNAATVHAAALVLVPVRTSVLEIDAAVRSFAHVRHVQRYRSFSAPVLLATIAPDDQRAGQRTLLGNLLRDCDPDRDLLPGEPSELMVDAPFLDEATLLNLFDERPIWRDPDLMARCRAFATATMAGAEIFHAMLAEHADDF